VLLALARLGPYDDRRRSFDGLEGKLMVNENLNEMAADDFSSRRSERRLLAAALVEMAATGWAPCCALASVGSGVLERVSRLLKVNPTFKTSAVLATGLGIAAILVPISAALLT
jgi:hypothetical protein